MQILLVTADLRYADEVVSTAAGFDVRIVRLEPADDLDAAVRRYTPNAIVIDAQDTVTRAARLANVVAALHPRITVVLVSARARERVAGNLRVIDKWRSADRLIGELRSEHLGYSAPAQPGMSSGE